MVIGEYSLYRGPYSFYFMQRQVLGRARPALSHCPFQAIPIAYCGLCLWCVIIIIG